MGVGKTTIVKLLTGFYQQYEGQILINGRDVRTIRREDLRRLFSVVYQNYAKYETSFEQNLLPNAVGERREEVKTVLEATGLASVVKRLNKGIETPLGKLGSGGSGCIRRGMAIACHSERFTKGCLYICA